MTRAAPLESAIAVISRHQHEGVAPPVDVRAIAIDLGINLYFRIDLGPDISGKITRDSHLGGASGYAIVVNQMHGRRRQRFTIAHEIAHYVLHRDLIGQGESIVDNEMYRSNLSGGLESQANRFAAEILMPAPLIKVMYDRGLKNAGLLAERFDVSLQAMEIRLSGLHLDQYKLDF